MPELRIHVDPHADDLLAADLTRDLMDVLLRSRAESVEHVQGEARPNAKGTVIEWAELAVSFSAGLPAILGLVRSWRTSASPTTRIEIELDGDRLVLDGPAPEQEQRLVELFLQRHAGD